MTGFQPLTHKVTLYQGDYQQRIQEAASAAELAEMRLKREREKPDQVRTLAEIPDIVTLAEEFHAAAKVHDDLVAEAEAEGALVVTLRAVGRRKWSELVAAHPPRTEDDVPESVRKSDAELGVNDTALGEELLPLSIAELSDPDLQVADLLDMVSSAQFDLLYGTAFALNRGLGSDPKARPRLLPSPSTPETAN